MYKATSDLNDVLLVWQMVGQVVTAHQFNPPLVVDSGAAFFCTAPVDKDAVCIRIGKGK